MQHVIISVGRCIWPQITNGNQDTAGRFRNYDSLEIYSVVYVKVLNEPKEFVMNFSPSKEMGDHIKQK